MMSYRPLQLFAVLAMMTAAPSLAQSGVGFEIDGEGYEFTIPEGYCLPGPDMKPASQYIASLDQINDTMVDVQRCGTFGEDYILIKVQKDRPRLSMARPEFLAMASAHFQSQFGQQMIDQELTDAQQHVSKETSGQIEMTSGGIEYAGQDEDCAYLAGSSEVEAPGETYTVLYASCVTLAGPFSLNVHSYGLARDGAQHEELKARSRAAARAIKAL